eukprot:gene5484-6648_t
MDGEPDEAPAQVVKELEYEEEGEEGLALEVDTTPPVVTLLGAPYVEVLMREEYTDAGALAEDLRDGFLPVTVLGLSELSTTEVTPPGAPLILQYTATDLAGNQAVMVQREVAVVSPCTPPSYLCDESITAHTCATCDEGLHGNVTCVCLTFLSTDFVVTSEEAPEIFTNYVIEYIPEEDVTPPVITMQQGGGVLALTTGGALVYIHRVLLGETFEDPGAAAWDDIQGNLTASISRFGAAAAMDTSVVTSEDAPHIITYRVSDAAGNEAIPMRRRVYVYSPCGEVEDGRCSVDGLCMSLEIDLEGEEVHVAAPPEIKLMGPANVVLDPGSLYTLCTPSTPLAAMCDHGALANDPMGDGDLTSEVMGCSSRITSVGLAGCNLDTSQSSEQIINFTVTSSSDELQRQHEELSASLVTLTQQIAYPNQEVGPNQELAWEEGYSEAVNNVKALSASMEQLQANADSMITATENAASAAEASAAASETAVTATASGINLSYAINLPDAADLMDDPVS